MGSCALARVIPLAIWSVNTCSVNATNHRKVIAAETEVTHSIGLLHDANFVYAQTIAYLLVNAASDIKTKVEGAFQHALNLAAELATAEHAGQSVMRWLKLAKKLAGSWN
jgi:hypothetical protein